MPAFADLFESMLLFVTKTGYIKLVSGAEFETEPPDGGGDQAGCGTMKWSALQMLSAGDVLTGTKKVVLLTERGSFSWIPAGRSERT